jgi:hypothetical protein
MGTLVVVDLLMNASSHETLSMPAGITRLEIDVDGGNVEIVGTDDDTTTIDVTTHGGLATPRRSENRRDGTLVVDTSCRLTLSATCGVDYVIHVPRTIEVIARGSGTDYDMSALAGDVDVDLSGGDADISFQSVPVLVRGRLSGGDLTISVPEGTPMRVDADSSGGTERVDVATDPTSTRSIDARSSGGDIVVRYVSEGSP